MFRSIVLEKWAWPKGRKESAIFGVGEKKMGRKGWWKERKLDEKARKGRGYEIREKRWRDGERGRVKRVGQEKIGEANERIREKWRERERGGGAATEMAVQKWNVRLLRTTFELPRTNNDIYETRFPIDFEWWNICLSISLSLSLSRKVSRKISSRVSML